MSLPLFLCEIPEWELETLFEKHAIVMGHQSRNAPRLSSVKEGILGAEDDQIRELLEEVLRTFQSLQFGSSPKYRFDERWKECLRCLALDGYHQKKDEQGIALPYFVPVDSSIPEVIAVRDDLETALTCSQLDGSELVIGFLHASEKAFVEVDFNECLVKGRLALETLAKMIGTSKHINVPGQEFDKAKWGKLIHDLCRSGFIDENAECGITGVYSFVSKGAHKPVGLSETEFARLGRVLIVGLCYFLVQQFNSLKQPPN